MTLYSMTQHVPRLVPPPQPWRFDVPSALFGAAAMLLLVILAYAFRDKLQRVWNVIANLFMKVRHRLEASTEGHYLELVADWARSITVPAHVAPLDAIFIEPGLLVPLPVPQIAEETEHAQTVPQTWPLHRVLGDHPLLMIVGASGAGRTTALASLALACAAKGDWEGDLAGTEKLPQPIRERLPLYVPLPAMTWDEEGQQDQAEEQEEQHEGEKKPKGQKKTGVERLLSSAVATVAGSSGMQSLLRQHLQAGQAVVLVDGWDELPPQQRREASFWLVELISTLPGNLWLVGAGPRDYAPLTDAGFTPLTLAPWDTGQVETFAKRWVDARSTDDQTSSISPHDLAAELQRRARTGSSSLELSLQAFVMLSGHKLPSGRAALFDQVLDLLLWQEEEQAEKPWLLAACRSALGQIALELQQEKRATASRERIEAAIEAVLPPAEERTARATPHVFRMLTGERGLLRPAESNRYTFVHPLWQAYLAARQLVAVAPTNLVERLEDPHWSDTLYFYAELGDMGPLVAAWLRSPDDMFYTRLRTLGSWVSVAPKGAAWRDGAMAVLARTFLQPGPLAPTRQALAKTLAATGAPGAGYLLKQAIQHPDAELRAAAVAGLADIAGEADVPSFEAPLKDENPTVRETAVRALASLGIDASKRQLEQVLMEGDETLRPLAAEVLFRCGRESVDLLCEMAESEDMMTRRAAVFGLAEAGASGLLEKMARGDEQWVVRSAATTALEELEKKKRTTGIAPLPEIEHLPWLISWAAAQGESVGLGEAAQHMLRRALREGDQRVRLAAVQVLTRIGCPDDVALLQAALTDPNPAVASVAHRALAEISARYNLKIEARE